MQTILHYLPIVSIAVLIVVSAAILLVRSIRPGFNFYWLVAALGSLVVWLMVLLSRLGLPGSVLISSWRMETLYIGGPTLILDEISWPFALALVTLLMGVLFTDVARSAEQEWWHSAGCLFATGLGLVSVLAGDPISLLWSWVAIDIFEFFLLVKLAGSTGIGSISWRMGGVMIFLLAGGSGEVQILAGIVRLGAIFHNEGLLTRRGFGTLTRLIPAASSLVLIIRVALLGISDSSAGWLIIVPGILSILAGISWVMAKTELAGFTSWILVVASLSVASAARNQPYAGIAWGIIMMLSGGVLFLASARSRTFKLLPLLGLAMLSGLPFTPGWDMGLLFTPPFNFNNLLFIVAHSLLLYGYFRQVFLSGENLTGAARGVGLVYSWGLLLLPIAHVIIGLWSKAQTPQFSTLHMPIAQRYGLVFWSGALAVLLAFLWSGLGRIHIRKPGWFSGNLPIGISTSRLIETISPLFRPLDGIVRFSSLIIEGEGGLLWTLLFLALLLAFFIQG